MSPSALGACHLPAPRATSGVPCGGAGAGRVAAGPLSGSRQHVLALRVASRNYQSECLLKLVPGCSFFGFFFHLEAALRH